MPFVEPEVDIWLAAQKGQLEQVKSFLASGVAVNARDRFTRTPLHVAAEKGHLAICEYLLDNGADPNIRTKPDPGERQGGTALHEAIMARHKNVAELLLARGANINAKMSDGFTPLLLAIEAGTNALARRLIELGADIHLSEQMGHTPFTAAVLHHDFTLADELLKRGSNPNQRIEPFHCTLLMSACGEKCLDEVQFLLRAGADVNLEDDRGQTALQCAVTGAAVRVTAWSSTGKGLHDEDKPENAPKIVELLLGAGADPLAKDDEGSTPIANAKKFRLSRITDLLEAGAKK